MSAMLDFDRMWTPEDIDFLPGDLDWRRVEIVDGLLVVSPFPGKLHLSIADAVFLLLSNAAPPSMHVTGSNAPIGLGRTYRAPDAAVLTRGALTSPGSIFTPAEVLLTVEVESPSSVTTDRITTPAEYASAGIAHCWRVETDPLRLTAYALHGDVYAQVGVWEAGDTAHFTSPFPVTVELDTLLP